MSSSLPPNPSPRIKAGIDLFGDNLTTSELEKWYREESEAFFSQNATSANVDPWYAYMRYVNRIYGFSYVRKLLTSNPDILSIGPADGTELDDLKLFFEDPQIFALEASENFQSILSKKDLNISIVKPSFTGDIKLEDNSISLALALSVLHHIPNVAYVLNEINRTLRPNGIVLVREPCSAMGIWGSDRGCTPNERGISKAYLLSKAKSLGWTLLRKPLPIHFEPMNKVLHKSNLYRSFSPFKNYSVLFIIDLLVSRVFSKNDHYWRQTILSKFGPSSYFYIFSKK